MTKGGWCGILLESDVETKPINEHSRKHVCFT